MKFGVLGPVAAGEGAGALTFAAPMVRSLLGVLLVEAGRAVSEARLIDLLWGETPPATAKASLQNHVLRLRRGLGAPEGERVRRTVDGYLIEVGPGELDLHKFEDLRRAGADKLEAGQVESAAEDLAAALELWRGEPLADVNPGVREAIGLEYLGEARLQTVELLARAWLRLGRYEQVVTLLGPEVREHPWREGMHGHLMYGLFGVGRQADALAVYQNLRANLDAELGIEPSAMVAELHQRILAGDPALLDIAEAAEPEAVAAAAPAPPAPEPPPAVVPRQLPPRAEHFTGRRDTLTSLTGLLDDAATAPLIAIVGTAGVGKTALAVQWAGDVAERFPDGCLYVDLRGFDPGGGPGVAPEQAIRGFLRALGRAPGEIPSELADLTGLFRSLLAGRRLVVVLDNARDAEQVRPLLSGAPGCLTIVTSRDRLTGLVAVDGARLFRLDLLPAAEAVELLARRLEPEQAEAAPEAVAELAELCARLPLALNIAAARIATSPHLELAGLARLLRGGERLGELDDADPAASVRTVFSWSYRQLSTGAARLFRLLGLHPGPDITVAAAASLAAAPVRQTRALLAELVGAHLLTEHAAGRYAFHDLLRVYAVEQARATETGADQDAAVLRSLDHYVHTAGAAVLLVSPNQLPLGAAPVTPGTSPEPLRDAEHAMAWFTAEKDVLIAAVAAAAESGHDAHVWQLAWALTPYYSRQGHHHDVVVAQHAALDAADRAGDAPARARSRRLLSQTYSSLGLYDLALVHAQEALAASTALDDPRAVAGSHRALAYVYVCLNDNESALRHTRQAHEIFVATGWRPGQAFTLDETGYHLILLGRHREALGCSEQALELFRELGDRFGEATAWTNTGSIHYFLGDFERAADCQRRSALLNEEIGAPERMANALTELGDALTAMGDLDGAREAWGRALAVHEEASHPDADKVRAKLAELPVAVR